MFLSLQAGSTVTSGQQRGGAVTVSLEETHVEVLSVCLGMFCADNELRFLQRSSLRGMFPCDRSQLRPATRRAPEPAK